MVELMLEITLENILFPNVVNKQRSIVLRFFCGFVLFLYFFGVSFLCLYVGSHMLIENFQNDVFTGFTLIAFGCIQVWYFFYNLNNVKHNKSRK